MKNSPSLTNKSSAFNSALVIYSSLLIKAYAELQPNVVSLGDVAFRRDLLHQAIECLMSLDHGNVMTEKCARYTMKLDRVLDALSSYTSLLILEDCPVG